MVFKEGVKLNEITEVYPNTILVMCLKEKIRTQIQTEREDHMNCEKINLLFKPPSL